MIKSAKRCLKKSIGKNCLCFDELYTLIVEVEAVLNLRPLTYVSSEDTEEPLTPSHLLVGYRILTLPDSSIPDDPDYSPEGLTRRLSHLSLVMKHFWNRWKKEYLLELREFHRSCEKHGSTYIVQRGDIVTVYDEGHPRGLWRLGKIEDLVCGTDGVVRGVCLRVTSKTGTSKIIRRPLQHIFPLEVRSNHVDEDSITKDTDPVKDHADSTGPDIQSPLPKTGDISNTGSPTRRRPVRRAADQARARILDCVMKD